MVDHTIPPDLAGARADKAVAQLAGVSRSVARTWCESGEATVDGEATAPAATISEGQVIRHPEPPVEQPLQPDASVPFTVLHDEQAFAVVDKPAGVVVHPGAGRRDATLAAGLLARWPDLEGVGQPGRWGLVHRLDRETSGALIVARTAESYERLNAAMAAREIDRVYAAGVQGRLPAETGTIDAAIRRDPQRPIRMTVDWAGRPARTHYRVVAELDLDQQAVEVTLETGRTHQIRVHLSRIGHPVIGDRLYGWRGDGWSDRICLHARRVQFHHPLSGEPVIVDAPFPSDLQNLAEVFAG